MRRKVSGDCSREHSWPVLNSRCAVAVRAEFERRGTICRNFHKTPIETLRAHTDTVRSTLIRRTAVILAATLMPFWTAVIVTPAVSFADCDDGTWWDPVNNVCQPTVVEPVPCDNDWWWDPYVNICRPPMVGPPLTCGNDWWWDPVIGRCRPPVIPPQ